MNSHHTPNLNIVSNTLTADEVAFGDWIVNGPISGEHWYFNWTEEKIMNEEKGVNLVTTTSKCGCGLTGVHLPGSMCDMASRSLGNGWIAYNGGAPRGCEGQYQVIGKNEYEGGVVTLVNGGRPQSHINWNAVVYYRKVEEENLRHFTEGATLSALLDRMALDDCPKKLLVRAIQAKGDQSIKDFIEETSEQHMKTLERKGYEFTWLQEEQRKMREAAEKADFEAFCRLVCKRVNNLCMDRCTFDPKTLQFTFYDLDVVWHNTPLLREFHMRGGDPRDVAVIIRNTTNPLRARAEQRQNREKTCREFNSDTEHRRFYEQIQRDGACPEGVAFVQNRLYDGLASCIREARKNHTYSKWLDDYGYTFSWEKKEENVTHVAGNRYSLMGTEYLLAFRDLQKTDQLHTMPWDYIAMMVNMRTGEVSSSCGSPSGAIIPDHTFGMLTKGFAYKLTHKAGEQI